MSLISLPAFLLTRPPTSHSKESFLYWGVPGRALRQVKLVVRNVAAGLLCLPTGAGQCSMGAYSRRQSAKAAIQAAPAAPITTI